METVREYSWLQKRDNGGHFPWRLTSFTVPVPYIQLHSHINKLQSILLTWLKIRLNVCIKPRLLLIYAFLTHSIKVCRIWFQFIHNNIDQSFSKDDMFTVLYWHVPMFKLFFPLHNSEFRLFIQAMQNDFQNLTFTIKIEIATAVTGAFKWTCACYIYKNYWIKQDLWIPV